MYRGLVGWRKYNNAVVEPDHLTSQDHLSCSQEKGIAVFALGGGTTISSLLIMCNLHVVFGNVFAYLLLSGLVTFGAPYKTAVAPSLLVVVSQPAVHWEEALVWRCSYILQQIPEQLFEFPKQLFDWSEILEEIL